MKRAGIRPKARGIESAGQVRLTASTLYAVLKRLLEDKWIRELAERPDADDPRRRYYRITAAGRAAGRAEAERLARLAEMAREKRWLPKPRRTRS